MHICPLPWAAWGTSSDAKPLQPFLTTYPEKHPLLPEHPTQLRTRVVRGDPSSAVRAACRPPLRELSAMRTTDDGLVRLFSHQRLLHAQIGRFPTRRGGWQGARIALPITPAPSGR